VILYVHRAVRLLVGLILLPAEAYPSRLDVSCATSIFSYNFLTREEFDVYRGRCLKYVRDLIHLSINFDYIFLLPIIANTGILFGDGR